MDISETQAMLLLDMLTTNTPLSRRSDRWLIDGNPVHYKTAGSLLTSKLIFCEIQSEREQLFQVTEAGQALAQIYVNRRRYRRREQAMTDDTTRCPKLRYLVALRQLKASELEMLKERLTKIQKAIRLIEELEQPVPDFMPLPEWVKQLLYVSLIQDAIAARVAELSRA